MKGKKQNYIEFSQRKPSFSSALSHIWQYSSFLRPVYTKGEEAGGEAAKTPHWAQKEQTSMKAEVTFIKSDTA